MKLTAIATLALLLALPTSAQTPQDWPACEVSSGTLRDASSDAAVARMRVRRGSSCTIAHRGNTSYRYTVVDGPRNGTASADGARAVYRPNDGFAGTDVFVVRVTGGQAPSFITVNVEVR